MVNGPMSQVRPNVLVVDDDAAVRDSFVAVLGKQYELLFATNGPEALRVLGSHDIRLVLLDIRMPGMDGIEVLRRIKEMNEQTDVIVVTAVKSLKTAVEAIKLGAFDYVTKPFDIHEILALAKRVVEKQDLLKEVLYLRSEVARDHQFENLVGKNARMQEIYTLITRVADNNATVLLTGESGTGKEVLARAIHQQSNRAAKPFVAVNCAAIPAELLESELFGHEKGAFTGAIATKVGKFELATGGTLFLDEVGSMRLDLQAKILRALQEREVERVGGTRTIKIDVRVLAATNRDLKRAVEEGAFREDLYYRLNVVPITLPDLKDRQEDIPLLANHFMRKFSQESNPGIREISKEAMAILLSYPWPGNVRELENVIERAVTLGRGEAILPEDLPPHLAGGAGPVERALAHEASLEELEREYIHTVLRRTKWHQIRAASILGIDRRTLYRKIRRYGIKPDLD